MTAERHLVHALGASCNTPVGAHARWRRRRPAADRRLGRPARRLGVAARQRDRRPGGDRSGVRPADAGRRRGRAAGARRGGAGGVTVYLVGAGPGDPGLLTARALELIAAADVIVYDRLIPATALDGARPDAAADLRRQGGRRPLGVPGGDRSGCCSSTARPDARSCGSRAGTRSSSAAAARRPSCCARPGCRSRSSPGSPPAVAASAYAGIPVTHRDAASAVAFVTGHEDPDKPESALDWEALARFPGTLVCLHGRPPAGGDHPAADRRRPAGV